MFFLNVQKLNTNDYSIEDCFTSRHAVLWPVLYYDYTMDVKGLTSNEIVPAMLTLIDCGDWSTSPMGMGDVQYI